MSGPGPALLLAAIGHLTGWRGMIDRAALLLAPHWPDLTVARVRAALADPAKVREALENAAPEGAALLYGPDRTD